EQAVPAALRAAGTSLDVSLDVNGVCAPPPPPPPLPPPPPHLAPSPPPPLRAPLPPPAPSLSLPPPFLFPPPFSLFLLTPEPASSPAARSAAATPNCRRPPRSSRSISFDPLLLRYPSPSSP